MPTALGSILAALWITNLLVNSIEPTHQRRATARNGDSSVQRKSDPVAANRSGDRDGPFKRRGKIDTSGLELVAASIPPWNPQASLETIAELWTHPGIKALATLDGYLQKQKAAGETTSVVRCLILRAMFLNSEREPGRAYEALEQARSLIEHDEKLSRELLYTVIYFQGVARCGAARTTTASCAGARARASCPSRRPPSTPTPSGSRLAIRHFTEYLEQFPDDLEVRWLLNLAHMTLGEYPGRGRSAVPDLAGSIPQLRVRHRQVPRRRPPGGGQPLQPGGRRDHGGLRQRRPARPRRHRLRPHRAAGVLPQQGRWRPSRTGARRPA